MAQPNAFGQMFMGAKYLKANREYSVTALETEFPGARMFVLKTKTTKSAPVLVTVKGGALNDSVESVQFQIEFNESTAWDGTTPLRLIFNKDVTVAIAKQVETS